MPSLHHGLGSQHPLQVDPQRVREDSPADVLRGDTSGKQRPHGRAMICKAHDMAVNLQRTQSGASETVVVEVTQIGGHQSGWDLRWRQPLNAGITYHQLSFDRPLCTGERPYTGSSGNRNR